VAGLGKQIFHALRYRCAWISGRLSASILKRARAYIDRHGDTFEKKSLADSWSSNLSDREETSDGWLALYKQCFLPQLRLLGAKKKQSSFGALVQRARVTKRYAFFMALPVHSFKAIQSTFLSYLKCETILLFYHSYRYSPHQAEITLSGTKCIRFQNSVFPFGAKSNFAVARYSRYRQFSFSSISLLFNNVAGRRPDLGVIILGALIDRLRREFSAFSQLRAMI